MIGKVTRGSDTAGLLRYLYGPGRANEHVNPHLVASWRGDSRTELDVLEPTQTGGLGIPGLASRLNLPLRLLPNAPEKPVWQCSMRVADGDRRLSDAEWATVARGVVERTGFAPDGDPGGCRWVAVRHADDHIHIVVVLARQDGGKVEVFRDWPKVHAAARAVEKRFGLQQVTSPDRTATPAPTRAEVEKAARLGQPEAARKWLAREVRVAVAGSASREEFASTLTGRGDLLVSWRYSQRTSGEVTGYRVGRVGDLNAHGQQVWFSGSKLAPDLSLPKLAARWREVSTQSVPGQRSPLTTDQRHRALGGAERALARTATQPLTPARAVAVGEVTSTLARVVEGPPGGPLTRAADHLARAVRPRQGLRPRMHHRVHDLRLVAAELSMLGHLLPGEARNVLLIVAHLTRITAAIASAHDGSGAARPVEQKLAAERASMAMRAYVGHWQPGGNDEAVTRTGPAERLGPDSLRLEPEWEVKRLQAKAPSLRTRSRQSGTHSRTRRPFT